MRKRRKQVFFVLTAVPLAVFASALWNAFEQIQFQTRNEAMVTAIVSGKAQEAISMLRAGADPDSSEVLGSRPSFWEELVSRLTGKYQPRTKGSTALILAAKYRETPVVRELLNRGAKNLEAVDGHEATVLTLEAENGHWQNVSMLVDRGADPSGSKKCYDSPIGYAVGNHAPLEIVRQLLDAGANPEGRSEFGYPLINAAGYHNVEVMRLLISHKANLQAYGGGFGIGSPLVAAVSSPGTTAFERARRTEAVRLLIHSGADVKHIGYRDETPFRCAAELSDYPMMRLLLKAGATPNVGDIYGSPLMHASYSGDLKMMKFLIDAGADVNMVRAKWGETALDDAAEAGRMDAVKLLLRHGARVHFEDENHYGSNPVRRATEEGHHGIAKYLKAMAKLQARQTKRRLSRQ